MRVLYVTSGFPFPLTAGQLRHWYLLRGLGRDHDVVLASLVDPGFDEGRRRGVEPLLGRIEVFGGDEPPILRTRARRKLAGLAPRLAGGATGAMRAALRSMVAEDRFDVVVVAGRRTTPLVRDLGLPIVADLCDATSARLRAGLPHRGVHAAGDVVELAQARGVERWAMRHADRVLFASERDAELVAGSRRDRVVVVPNGVDAESWHRSSPELGRSIVFFGNLSYPPNDDAATHLIRDVLPAVRRDHPEITVTIVGQDPSPRLVAAASTDPRVEVTGFVDSVVPHLDRAAVVAAPLRSAAGIQNKVLQAMAMAVPVVTTPAGAAGLHRPGTAPPPLTVAEPGEAFARALSDRLAAVAADPTPDHAARAYVLEHFDWSRSVALVDEALRAAAAGRGARTGAP